MANKRALIVAINNYGGPPNDLPSCLEEMAAFCGRLISYGFRDQLQRPDDVKPLSGKSRRE